MNITDDIIEQILAGKDVRTALDIEKRQSVSEAIHLEIVDDTTGAIKNLGEYLDGVYNQGKRWTCGKVEPTMAEVAELYDLYQNVVHNGVNVKNITTISKNVKDCLETLGFKVKEDGVGWRIENA